MGAKAAVAPVAPWLAAFVAPTAWAVTLLLNYVLASRACRPGIVVVLLLIAAAMFVVVCLDGWWSWRLLQGTLENGETGAFGDRRFAAHLNLLSCALFAVAIAAQFVAPWMIRDCH